MEPPGHGLPRAREVGVAGADEDGVLAMHVAHGDAALGDGRAGPGAGVRRDPLRAADRGDAVAPVGAKAPALVRAPELAALRARHGGGAGARLGAPARRRGAAQVDVGRAAGAGALAHAEYAAVAAAGLRRAVRERGGQRDLAAARVDDGARRQGATGAEDDEA